MDFDRLPVRRNRHHPADRAAHASVRPARLHHRHHLAVPHFFDPVWPFVEPGKHDRIPGPAGPLGRRLDPDGAHAGDVKAAPIETCSRHGHLRFDCDPRAFDGTDGGRLPGRDLRLAVHFLHQLGARPAADRRYLVGSGQVAAQPRPAGRCRLVWHRADGAGAGLLDHHARGRQLERLVRIELHHHLCVFGLVRHFRLGRH